MTSMRCSPRRRPADHVRPRLGGHPDGRARGDGDGVPVVTTDVGAAAEAVLDGVTGASCRRSSPTRSRRRRGAARRRRAPRGAGPRRARAGARRVLARPHRRPPRRRVHRRARARRGAATAARAGGRADRGPRLPRAALRPARRAVGGGGSRSGRARPSFEATIRTVRRCRRGGTSRPAASSLAGGCCGSGCRSAGYGARVVVAELNPRVLSSGRCWRGALGGAADRALGPCLAPRRPGPAFRPLASSAASSGHRAPSPIRDPTRPVARAEAGRPGPRRRTRSPPPDMAPASGDGRRPTFSMSAGSSRRRVRLCWSRPSRSPDRGCRPSAGW